MCVVEGVWRVWKPALVGEGEESGQTASAMMASSKVRSGMGIELPAACQIRIMSGWFGVRGGSGMVSGKPCRRSTSRGEKKRG